MKILILTIALLLFSMKSMSQTPNENYDSALAKSFGADEYGMKNYFFVILKTGSNKSEDEKLIDSAFTGHMNNINRLAEEGSLVLAGPFGANDKKFRGIFILNAPDIDHARNIVETDPAVKAQLLDFEIYPWYGTAALQDVSNIHKKLSKFNF